MGTLRVAAVVLVLVGLGVAVAGRVISARRGERPAGPRFLSLLAGGLLVGSAVAVIVAAVADHD